MSSLTVESYVTVGEVADFLRVQSWQVQRLFERGTLPEPPRFGGRRMISKELIPQIVSALQARGWYPPKKIDPSKMLGLLKAEEVSTEGNDRC